MKTVHFNTCTSTSFQGSEIYCRLTQAYSGPDKQGIFHIKSIGLLGGRLKKGRTYNKTQRGYFRACFLSPFLKKTERGIPKVQEF